ncbi:MAG: FkbM family methyltransferase, partial [Planctomycetota bacterium]
PRIRGGSQIGSLLLRLMPFLDTKAFLELEGVKCTLDLKYRTHFAFLMSSFEPLESYIVLSILNKGDVFFDIGGNWGYYAFLGSVAVGDQGKVVTVEANRKTFHRMQEMLVASGLNNVIPFNIAMSNVTGDKVSMSLPWYKVDTGGFIKAGDSRFDVRTKTLDLLWFQLGSPRVKMIKIDTEGAEPPILEGGTRFFTEGLTSAALIEISNWTKQRFGYEPTYIYKKMQEFGFNHAYGVAADKLIELEMPVNESNCFLGNVFFGKTNLSESISKWLELTEKAQTS